MSLFKVHLLNSEGIKKAHILQSKFEEMENFISSLAVEGRELEIAKTKLEEASFFAKKAMAINPENQEILCDVHG